MKSDEVDLEDNKKLLAKHLLQIRSCHDFQAEKPLSSCEGKISASASLESSENIEGSVDVGSFTEMPHFLFLMSHTFCTRSSTPK